jgi:RNA polymerase sigma-70 factor (ECF subfamily)
MATRTQPAEAPLRVGEDDTIVLVDRAREGDAEAFAAIYDRYVDKVYRFIYFKVAHDQALAEDLTSDTFIRALRRIREFSWQGRDIGAWLITIARNLIFDHYKSGRVRLEAVGIDPSFEATDDVVDPENEALQNVTRAELRVAISQLNPDQAEVIELRFLQDLSVSETAAALDKTEGAIKAMQFRAIKSLYRFVIQLQEV